MIWVREEKEEKYVHTIFKIICKNEIDRDDDDDDDGNDDDDDDGDILDKDDVND